MSTQITITLPDEVYQRVERFARLANRDVASVLADTIQLSIPPITADIALRLHFRTYFGESAPLRGALSPKYVSI